MHDNERVGAEDDGMRKMEFKGIRIKMFVPLA
jgi:hypothetical protein